MKHVRPIPILLVVLLVVAGPARAAFPGRDGLLAVQPSVGAGIVLVNADGRGERRVCAKPTVPCAALSPGRLFRPRWAPDGRSLLIGTSSSNEAPGAASVILIYPDGSCLACLGFPAGTVDVSFTRDPLLYTTIASAMLSARIPEGAILEYGIDGLRRRIILPPAQMYPGWSDPVWSSRGELAVEGGGWIWAGDPKRLHHIARGRAVSWSPDGRRLAFTRDGWLTIGGAHGGRLRRLVRGSAPAWSPSGRWIAFFNVRHRLSLVRAGGGTVRRVGAVTGAAVDWQPLHATRRAACIAPPGSVTAASSPTAIVTGARSQFTYGEFFTSAYMGCLRASGRERLLAGYPPPGYATVDVSRAALAGPYAALATNTDNSHDQRMISSVDVYDLRTGLRVSGRGGETASCEGQTAPPCVTAVDQIVLGADGVSAVRTTVTSTGYLSPLNGFSCGCTIEQIQASDRSGVRTLDSVTDPAGSPLALAGLALNGDTLTWDHGGSPHAAQLQP